MIKDAYSIILVKKVDTNSRKKASNYSFRYFASYPDFCDIVINHNQSQEFTHTAYNIRNKSCKCAGKSVLWDSFLIK